MNGLFGFLVLDKPAGLTSHDCVNRLRKIYGIKRIGHGGTLDPSVTGVLPIAIGPATRLLSYLPSLKTYTGTIQLGKKTSSDDLFGEVIATKSWPEINFSDLNKHLDSFRGNIKQIPPQISSIHFNGQRAYKIARQGRTMDLPSRKVEIMELKLIDWDQCLGQLKIHIHCSSGTYIRSIARDLGEALGCFGCLAKLRRTQALGFKENQSIQLPIGYQDQSIKPPKLLSPILALKHLPIINISLEQELLWSFGRKIEFTNGNPDSVIQLSENYLEKGKHFSIVSLNSGELIGIGEWEFESSMIKPKIVFNAK